MPQRMAMRGERPLGTSDAVPLRKKHWLGRVLAALLVVLFASRVIGAEVIPPAPKEFFNDYAKAISPQVARKLNDALTQFERETSNQILVAIFQKMPSDTSVEDYCQNVFRAWNPGQKDKNNGAILFVFLQDRKMRIQTGYGLEGALPDITCKRIIQDEIAPYFKKGLLDAGIATGVQAMIAATKGEYKGTGKTRNETKREKGTDFSSMIFILVVALFVLLGRMRRTAGTSFDSSGRRSWNQGWHIPPGGGFSGGGFSGGGFSGGGGDSGGGGASGSW